MKKFYYELKSPASAVASKQEVTHMTEADLLSDALMRLDNMYDDAKSANDQNMIDKLSTDRAILHDDRFSFEYVKFPILKDVYDYDDQILIRTTNKDELDSEVSFDF